MNAPPTSASDPTTVGDSAAGRIMRDEPGPWRRSPVRKVILYLAIVVFAGFWTWALFFASKEAVNKIGDEAWAERAEAICVSYEVPLQQIESQREADPVDRAELVVSSTDLMSAMLDEIMAVPPTDEKGQAIVPDWAADYRILLQDRYHYADRLRAGENVPFTETAIDGVPITERIETFAKENGMFSCAPPRGSIV